MHSPLSDTIDCVVPLDLELIFQGQTFQILISPKL